MNTGGTNYELEMSSLKRNFDTPDSPVRVRLTPGRDEAGRRPEEP